MARTLLLSHRVSAESYAGEIVERAVRTPSER